MAASPVTTKDDGDGVAILLLDHPPVNALSGAVLDALGAAIASTRANQSTRAVILSGSGSYFSAGADLKEISTLDRTSAPARIAKTQATLRELEGAPFPSIAAINGLAVGGGLELALACDLRVCGEAAKLGAPEVQYGLMPAYGGTQRLPRTVGVAKAKELIFGGAMIPSAEALRIGLVNKVVASGQELRAARDLAHTIAGRAPLAVRAAKRAILEGIERPLAEGLRLEGELFAKEVLLSADLTEGLTAFREHRPPRFQGR